MSEEPKLALHIDPAVRAVEVKITARIQDEDRVLALVARSNEVPQTRTVYFFDTPDLALFDLGLILRARKVTGDEDDSTVKLRPVDPKHLDGLGRHRRVRARDGPRRGQGGHLRHAGRDADSRRDR